MPESSELLNKMMDALSSREMTPSTIKEATYAYQNFLKTSENKIQLLSELFNATFTQREISPVPNQIYDRMLCKLNDLASSMLLNLDITQLVKPPQRRATLRIDTTWLSQMETNFESQIGLNRHDTSMISPNEILNKSGNMLLDTSMYAADANQIHDANEKNSELMKALASLRIKARLLVALSKNTADTTRTAFIRWHVRTHKKLGKKCISSLAIKGKVSVQVAFWRFKFFEAI